MKKENYNLFINYALDEIIREITDNLSINMLSQQILDLATYINQNITNKEKYLKELLNITKNYNKEIIDLKNNPNNEEEIIARYLTTLNNFEKKINFEVIKKYPKIKKYIK